MLKRIKNEIIRLSVLTMSIITIYGTKVLATTIPDEDEVNEIASKGIRMFFGMLAGFAVLMGGMELYGAFMAHKENVDLGGFGGSQNKVREKVIAGVMCLIAAGVIFIVMGWIQRLFNLA